MPLKLNAKFIIAFLTLTFVMHEAHEIVHTSIGRLICGCWGERDFNVWGLCGDCSEEKPYSIIATFAGPIFTFGMIWLGASWLGQNRTNKEKTLGFSLLFANMPFARILTAAFGGGDEVYGLNKILENHQLAWIIGLGLLLLISFYPLYKAYHFIENKYKIGWFLLFLLVPVFIDLLVVLGLMNTLLQKGILSNYWILGSPVLVTVWTVSVLVIFLVARKGIYTLEKSA